MTSSAITRLSRYAFVVLVAATLSACFSSKRELVGAAESEFPYDQITFVEVGTNEPTTLVHKDGAYRSLEEDNSVAIRFKKIATDTYVAQAAGDDGGKTSYLFAVLKVNNAANVVQAYKAVAQDGETAPGLYRCDDDTLCFDTLQPYIDYTLKAIASGAKPDATYRIVGVKAATP